MAYTPPLYNEVHFETTTGYVAPAWNALDADLGVGDAGDTNVIGVSLSSSVGATTASGKASIVASSAYLVSSFGESYPGGRASALVSGSASEFYFGTVYAKGAGTAVVLGSSVVSSFGVPVDAITSIAVTGASAVSYSGFANAYGAGTTVITGDSVSSFYGNSLARIIVVPIVNITSAVTTSKTSRSAFVFSQLESSVAAYRRSGFSKPGGVLRTSLLNSSTTTRVDK